MKDTSAPTLATFTHTVFKAVIGLLIALFLLSAGTACFGATPPKSPKGYWSKTGCKAPIARKKATPKSHKWAKGKAGKQKFANKKRPSTPTFARKAPKKDTTTTHTGWASIGHPLPRQ